MQCTDVVQSSERMFNFYREDNRCIRQQTLELATSPHGGPSSRHTRRQSTIPKTATLAPAPSRPVPQASFHSTTICLGDRLEIHDPELSVTDSSHQSVKMPSEVSDIKQFIEICRRKDAKCTFTTRVCGRSAASRGIVAMRKPTR